MRETTTCSRVAPTAVCSTIAVALFRPPAFYEGQGRRPPKIPFFTRLAMHDESAQEGFLRETKAQAISEEEIPSLPELTSGQILVMVEAEQRVDDAVNILNRHNAITAGVRMPTT
jgi:hypothetical protein